MKFIYQENVQVKSGFYKGQRGKIVNLFKFPFLTTRYEVYFTNGNFVNTFIEDELLSLDNPTKNYPNKVTKIK